MLILTQSMKKIYLLHRLSQDQGWKVTPGVTKQQAPGGQSKPKGDNVTWGGDKVAQRATQYLRGGQVAN